MLVRHYFPGVGDPFALPIARFHRYRAYCDRIESFKENGGTTQEDRLFGAIRQLTGRKKRRKIT